MANQKKVAVLVDGVDYTVKGYNFKKDQEVEVDTETADYLDKLEVFEVKAKTAKKEENKETKK